MFPAPIYSFAFYTRLSKTRSTYAPSNLNTTRKIPKILPQDPISIHSMSPDQIMSESRRSGPCSGELARPTEDQLIKQLEESLEIYNMEEGLQLVGVVIAQKLPNKRQSRPSSKLLGKNMVKQRLFGLKRTYLPLR